MSIGYNLTFDSNAQHLTTGASTNVLDVSTARNIGAGRPIYLVAMVTAAMTDTGSDSTMTLTLETDDNDSFSSATTVQTLGTFSATSAVGTKLQSAIVDSDLYERYIRVKYTVANGDLTTGSFSAYLATTVDSSRAYPDAL